MTKTVPGTTGRAAGTQRPPSFTWSASQEQPPLSAGLSEQWLAEGSSVTGALPARKSAFVPWGRGWEQARPREGREGGVQSSPAAGLTEQAGTRGSLPVSTQERKARGACSARGTRPDHHAPACRDRDPGTTRAPPSLSTSLGPSRAPVGDDIFQTWHDFQHLPPPGPPLRSRFH